MRYSFPELEILISVTRMAHEKLLAWADKRLPWQQDALRRLAIQGEFTAEDLLELELQIKQAAGLPAEDAPDSVPLSKEHLNQAGSNKPSTVLASLGPVRNVDRLSADQPPLQFAINGITLVYGANASGKSGYCRIARQLCRSLSPVDLRGNIYGSTPQDQAEVAIAFRVGGDDQPKEELIWYTDQDPPIELSRISVFDNTTASVYIDGRRKIEFLPYELDILNKLGVACRSLEESFKERLVANNSPVNTNLPKMCHEGTDVQVMLARLVPQTNLENLPSELELKELGSWSPKKQAMLEDTEKYLKQGPVTIIQLRSKVKQALEIIKEEISSIENFLTDASLASILSKYQIAKTKRQTIENISKDVFYDQPISDLNSDAWRLMLKYAREFAVTVFPNVNPPQLSNGGLCVLCQQDLDDNATARMEAFDNYIAGKATEESRIADKALSEHRNSLMAFRVKPQREINALLTDYANLSDASKETSDIITDYVQKAHERLKSVQAALLDNQYNALHELDPLPDSPDRFVNSEISRLDSEITQLEVSECDEEALINSRIRRDNLSDQKYLSEQIQIIIEYRNRLEECIRLGNCITQCRSTAITRQITNRRREILTPTLRDALQTELNRLRLAHIPVDLTDHGQNAESIIEISLDTRQSLANKSDILSEGEQRSLALACFLAELQEIGTGHSIIIDDPVSSLDHTRMNLVAERLAEEASNGRQVIVFTHNILFHYMLSSAAHRAGVALHSEWMRSAGNDQFGLIDKSQKPKHMKKVLERLSDIDQDSEALAQVGYDHTNQDFHPCITDLYTKMRETWERVVEEILFNNAVQRFRPEVMTQRLEQACFDSSTDYPTIFEGMKRCSRYSGHDQAPDITPNLPELDEIRQDIAGLKAFVEGANKRRRNLEKNPRYKDGIKPLLL